MSWAGRAPALRRRLWAIAHSSCSSRLLSLSIARAPGCQRCLARLLTARCRNGCSSHPRVHQPKRPLGRQATDTRRTQRARTSRASDPLAPSTRVCGLKRLKWNKTRKKKRTKVVDLIDDQHGAWHRGCIAQPAGTDNQVPLLLARHVQEMRRAGRANEAVLVRLGHVLPSAGVTTRTVKLRQRELASVRQTPTSTAMQTGRIELAWEDATIGGARWSAAFSTSTSAYGRSLG